MLAVLQAMAVALVVSLGAPEVGEPGPAGQPGTRTREGLWLNLLRPDGDRLVSERLVNMRHQGYRRDEPNVQFTPDGKWVVFRGNFDGEVQLYAVEVAKAP